MTPQAFIARWRDNALTEKAGAQAHFEDLCTLLEVEPQRIKGEYQYERGLIKKSSASQGWAGYTPAMPDEAILRRLLALNLARSTTPETRTRELKTAAPESRRAPG